MRLVVCAVNVDARGAYTPATSLAVRPSDCGLDRRLASPPAGLTTDCVFKYGLTMADYHEAAKDIFVPGLAMICLAGVFLALITVRYRRLEDREATSKLYGLKQGEARLEPPRTASSPPLQKCRWPLLRAGGPALMAPALTHPPSHRSLTASRAPPHAPLRRAATHAPRPRCTGRSQPRCAPHRTAPHRADKRLA